MEEFLEETPLIVSYHSDNNFPFYGGGIYDGKYCKRKFNHVMVLVGHGRQNDEEY
jgi:hypothetical protein